MQPNKYDLSLLRRKIIYFIGLEASFITGKSEEAPHIGLQVKNFILILCNIIFSPVLNWEVGGL